jgi:hypothetical protein
MANRTEFPSQYAGPTNAQMGTALSAAQAGYYTAARLAFMNTNDLIYASKQLAKNVTLPAPNGTFVNPWENDGA